MTTNKDSLGLPMMLLVALWGAVNTTLEFFKIINERRDQVFEMVDTCGSNCTEILGPIEIYISNCMSMTIGLCIFLSIIVYFVLTIPKYMNITDEDEAKRAQLACRVIAILPAYGLFGFLTGGTFDVIMLILNYK